MSKVITVQFPDATDVTSLAKGSIVTVGSVAGGTIIQTGDVLDPPAPLDPTKFATSTHMHDLPEASGAVTIPATNGAVTIPAGKSGPPV